MSSTLPPVAPGYTPPASRLAPFITRTRKIVPRLCICSEGEPGSGKSHFGLTLPKPLAQFVCDRGFENPDEEVQKALQLDLVHTGLYRYVRAGGSDEALKSQGQEVLSAIKGDIRRILDAPKLAYRSVIFDTADEIWEILRLARYGKIDKIPQSAYGAMNVEYQSNFITPFLADERGINVVWVHKMKHEYKSRAIVKANGEASEMAEKTGRRIRAGFGKLDYDAPNKLSHTKDLTKEMGNGRFTVEIQKCINPEYDGLSFSELDFTTLAQMIYPNSDPEHWSRVGV